MFMKAKYEYERRNYYLKQLNEEQIPKTKLDKIKQFEKADKLSKIDANLAKRGYGRTYESPEYKTVINTYKDYQDRMEELTKSYIKQGYDIERAGNIANKIIHYEINSNNHPSIRKLKSIEQESKTFNLDKTIIDNMGINGKDAQKLLSKIESTELNKLNAKQMKELGFYTSEKAVQSTVSHSKEQNIDTTSKVANMDHSKEQGVVKDRDMGMEV